MEKKGIHPIIPLREKKHIISPNSTSLESNIKVMTIKEIIINPRGS